MEKKIEFLEVRFDNVASSVSEISQKIVKSSDLWVIIFF